MHIATNDLVVRPDGGPIKAVREAVYLGGMINCDGRATPEITRRLGEAFGIFNKFANIWSHARTHAHTAAGWKRTFKLYDSVVLSKLLYSLGSQ
eukprot:7129418-Pyramimonas_sp.AAC.1